MKRVPSQKFLMTSLWKKNKRLQVMQKLYQKKDPTQQLAPHPTKKLVVKD